MRSLLPLAIGLLLTPALAHAEPALHASPWLPLEVRDRILIEGDAAFTPENGVRGGTGAPEDPFIVSRYAVAQAHGAGIRIADTTAHVVVEDILVDGVAAPVGGLRGCVSPPPVACEPSRGVQLVNASNVTLRGVRVLAGATAYGIDVRGSRGVVIESSALGLPNPATGTDAPFMFGVLVHGSQDITMRGVLVMNATFPADVRDSADVLVHDSFFDGTGSDFHNVPTFGNRNVLFARNSFRDAGLYVGGLTQGYRILGNSFNGVKAIELSMGASNLVTDLVVCGNAMDHMEASLAAVFLYRAPGAIVKDNRISNASKGIWIMQSYSGTIRIEGNHISGSVGQGMHLQSGFEAHGNSFVGNALGVEATMSGNLTHNWWGSASGPSGASNGTGDRLLVRGGAVVPYAPWLPAAPPASAPDCGTPDLPRPAGWSGFQPRLAAGADASANANETAGPARVTVTAEASARKDAGRAPTGI